MPDSDSDGEQSEAPAQLRVAGLRKSSGKSAIPPQFLLRYDQAGDLPPWEPAWSPCEALMPQRCLALRREQDAKREALVRMLKSGEASKAAREVEHLARGSSKQIGVNQQLLRSTLKAMTTQRRELAESRQRLEDVLRPAGSTAFASLMGDGRFGNRLRVVSTETPASPSGTSEVWSLRDRGSVFIEGFDLEGPGGLREESQQDKHHSPRKSTSGSPKKLRFEWVPSQDELA